MLINDQQHDQSYELQFNRTIKGSLESIDEEKSYKADCMTQPKVHNERVEQENNQTLKLIRVGRYLTRKSSINLDLRPSFFEIEEQNALKVINKRARSESRQKRFFGDKDGQIIGENVTHK